MLKCDLALFSLNRGLYLFNFSPFQFFTFSIFHLYKKNPSYATPILIEGSSLYRLFKNRLEYSPLMTI